MGRYFFLTILLISCGILKAADGAAVYTRWGRTTCGSRNAELVYTGHVGGQRSDQSGGSSNYVCMAGSPVYGDQHDDDYHGWAYVFGTEYGLEPEEGSNFPFDVPDETPLHNRNAPCAVCAVPDASLALMIPGRSECHKGWRMEYTGYLVTEHVGNNVADFVCLDKSPEALPGGEGGENSATFYVVETQCGSLPCPPYQAYWEVACVVCTKRYF